MAAHLFPHLPFIILAALSFTLSVVASLSLISIINARPLPREATAAFLFLHAAIGGVERMLLFTAMASLAVIVRELKASSTDVFGFLILPALLYYS